MTSDTRLTSGSTTASGRSGQTEPALRGLFDHAGMFPPAEKPLAEALADAAAFPRSLRRPGIVGADLVLPWGAWANLTPAALDAAGLKGTCKVAIVGLPLAEAPAALGAARSSLVSASRIRVVSVEAHAEGDHAAWPLPSAVPGLVLYVEPKWTRAQWLPNVGALCRTLKAQGLGLKFRCAGPNAVDAATLAAIVRAAADAGIPLKATQGLHHPVASAKHPHGFLALTAAVRFRQALGPRFDDVEGCLAEPDAKAFEVLDGIRWKAHHVAAGRFATLPAFAIGSCSMSEPDDDLMAALGPPASALMGPGVR